jgi:hypothetical protein
MVKLRQLIPLVAILSACGDETNLHYYDAPPIPHSVQVTPPTAPANYVEDSADISGSVTMENCLGPLANKINSMQDLCPIDSEGECASEFEQYVGSLPDEFEAIVRENAIFNLLDLIDGGNLTLETTALVTYGKWEPSLEEFNVDYEAKYSSMLIMFGDQRDAMNAYLAGGRYLHTEDDNLSHIDNAPYGNFEHSHIRCTFSEWMDKENPEQRKYHAGVAFIKKNPESGEMETKLAVEIDYFNIDASWHHEPAARLRVPEAIATFPESTHNVAALKTAITFFTNAGLSRAQELLGAPTVSFYGEKGIFYFDE